MNNKEKFLEILTIVKNLPSLSKLDEALNALRKIKEDAQISPK